MEFIGHLLLLENADSSKLNCALATLILATFHQVFILVRIIGALSFRLLQSYHTSQLEASETRISSCGSIMTSFFCFFPGISFPFKCCCTSVISCQLCISFIDYSKAQVKTKHFLQKRNSIAHSKYLVLILHQLRADAIVCSMLGVAYREDWSNVSLGHGNFNNGFADLRR